MSLAIELGHGQLTEAELLDQNISVDSLPIYAGTFYEDLKERALNGDCTPCYTRGNDCLVPVTDGTDVVIFRAGVDSTLIKTGSADTFAHNLLANISDPRICSALRGRITSLEYESSFEKGLPLQQRIGHMTEMVEIFDRITYLSGLNGASTDADRKELAEKISILENWVVNKWQELTEDGQGE